MRRAACRSTHRTDPRPLHWRAVIAAAAVLFGGLLLVAPVAMASPAAADVVRTPISESAQTTTTGPATRLDTLLPLCQPPPPGARGLEGATPILGEGSSAGTDVIGTALISMIGISLGILLGLAAVGAGASRPWSGVGRRGRRLERVGEC